MKVLKKGREQNGWSTEQICTGEGNGKGGCGAKLLVEQGDLFHTYRSYYDGSEDTFTTFKCAQCGVKTDIKDVPYHVTSKLVSQRQWEQLRGD